MIAKKWTALFTLTVLVGIVLSACATPTPEVIEKVVTQVVKETIKETVVVEGTPQVVEKEVTKLVEKVVTPTPSGPSRGGTLYIGRMEDTETLDPQNSTTISSIEIDMMIYDSLVLFDYDMSIKPSLAESWEVSDDGTEYTFKLKDGVTFHSGDPFTAEDVVFTFERWKAFEGSPSAYNIAQVQKVEALDDLTVKFTLEAPYAIFLSKVASGWASILNKDFTEAAGEDYGVTVVDGTGPYKFVSWTRQEELVLERNEAYAWGSEIFDNQGAPYVDKIVWVLIPEAATRYAALVAGDIHMVPDVPAVRVASLVQHEGVNTIVFPQLNTSFMGMAIDKAPLDDIRVRRAINHAIDKVAIAEGAYYGLAEAGWGPIAPGTWGYWPGVQEIGYGYDQDKAVQLLEEAGWTEVNAEGIRVKDGQPLKLMLYWSSGAEMETIVPIMQDQLRQVGMDVELNLLEWTTYLEALRNHEHELMTMTVRYTDADILYFYFHSAQLPAPNRFAWDDPTTDELLDLSRTSVDENERLEAYKELQRIVIENAIWVPLLHSKRVAAARDVVQGVRIHPDNIFYKGLDLWLKE